MDSLTQLTLGAAVGEATLGKSAGNRAIMWGAIAGTLPDLDVIANPLLDEITQLGWHRGPSHAFFFLTIGAPILGWLISRVHGKYGSWRQWTVLVYFAFITHVILDTFTVYGTQLFRPFSHYPAAFNSISIIDPLYTL
ncbi:metal-dependent hydrolase, partial [candidate division GN15 bacterium]|nr:metal-dependent hydrolase [candidate division GN15 bacterium]